MRHILFGSLVAMLLAGCASAAKPTASATTDTVFTGFMAQAEGGERHEMSGLNCPADLDGMAFNDSKVFRPDGTDVGCTHAEQAGRIHTVFLTKMAGMSAQDYFQASMNDTGPVLESRGYAVDADASRTCDNASLDVTSVMSAFLNMDNNTAIIAPWMTVVYKSDLALSILAVDTVLPGEYIKQRYTLPGVGLDQVEAACDALRKWQLQFLNEVKSARGIKTNDVSALINASEEGGR